MITIIFKNNFKIRYDGKIDLRLDGIFLRVKATSMDYGERDLNKNLFIWDRVVFDIHDLRMIKEIVNEPSGSNK